MNTVPFNNLQPALAEEQSNLANAFARVFHSGRLILGPEVAEFERRMAYIVGFGLGIGVANGTDAIELMLREGLGSPCDVLVPANSAPATVAAIVRGGFTPVYCETLWGTGLINPETLGYFMTDKTRAILAVDLYGQVCNYAALHAFADAHNLLLFSDGAQSFGSKSDASEHVVAQSLSFYPTKALGALGDGGMILTDDSSIHHGVVGRRFYGIYDRQTLAQEFMGCNSRLDELQAAFLNERLTSARMWMEMRQKIAWFYHKWINDGLVRRHFSEDQNYHIFNIHVEHRDATRAALLARGVETAVHYPIPAHRQSPTMAHYRDLPMTEEFCATTLSLPIWAGMTPEQIAQVTDAVNEVCR